MRVAVPSDTDQGLESTRSGHFGHSPYFTIATVEDGKVEKVAVSTRQTDAPAFITTEGGVSLKMEKILAGAPKSAEEEGAVKSHRVLEVNAKHPVFEVMQKAQEAGDDEKVKLYSGILYDQALLVEGIPLDDPVAYTEAVTKLMK